MTDRTADDSENERDDGINVGDLVDGRFRIKSVVGLGGMGVVLVADDELDEVEVALKYCHAMDQRRRFSREVRFMAGVEHKHVMPVLYHNLDHDPPFFVMPLADQSLADQAAIGLTEEDALHGFLQVCQGIQAIHSAGGTHRDIKPLNAMVLVDGTVVVTDLGLVKLDPRDTTVLTQTAAFLGTRMYCAPEQLIPGGARKADARTDIYQLGKTLYELLTGESPALMDLDRLPRGLAYVIERATREQPSKRYQSVGQLIDAVKDYGRSKNPKENPVESFESALAEAEASLAQKRYTPKNLLAMLQSILLMTDDAELVINSVDKIPDQLIPYMFSTAGEDFEKVLEAYSAAVESAVGGYGFAYAETVARKMRKVADSASSPSAKAYAIKATLIAAVKLNRYAAMDIFDGMLTKIDTTEDAMAVAEMLRENIEEYKSLAPRIPKARLNPILRAVQRDATATEP